MSVTKNYSASKRFWSIADATPSNQIFDLYSYTSMLYEAPFLLEKINSLSITVNFNAISGATATLYASNGSAEEDLQQDMIVATVAFNGTTSGVITLVNNGIALRNHLYLKMVFNSAVSSTNVFSAQADMAMSVSCEEEVYGTGFVNFEVTSNSGSGVYNLTPEKQSILKSIKKIYYVYVDNSFLNNTGSQTIEGIETFSVDHSLFSVTFDADIDRPGFQQYTISDYWRELIDAESINYNYQFTAGSIDFSTANKIHLYIVYTKAETIKYYDGSKFVPCTVNYYDGSKYVLCDPYYYNGTAWVPISTT